MLNYSEKLYIIERYFRGTQYESLLNETLNYYKYGNWAKVEECLNKFPSESELFEKLVEKLHGKSVFSTLKEISENKTNKIDEAKGISSLITHVLIEIRENKEYVMLLPILYEKLGNLIYAI